MNPPDFQRDVVCLAGLPFDRVDLASTVERVHLAIGERRRCWLSTANLDFVVGAQRDAAFRDTVWRSDLSVADGMPLVWMARLMGLGLPERVAGASLFERLCDETRRAVRFYFFGGPPGAAQRAGERLAARPSAARCAGHDSPGFGGVASMSEASRLARINASGADFLVVALGARKGQAWIEHNLDALETPVVAHLGAVVNFAAGTLRRAPRWVQAAGLEWLWRIKEEPHLWRRYAHDAAALGRLVLRGALPYAWRARRSRAGRSATGCAAECADDDQGCTLRLSGACVAPDLQPLRNALARAAGQAGPVRIDLREVQRVDAAAVALIGLLWTSRRPAVGRCTVVGARPAVRRVFECLGAAFLLAADDAAARPLAARRYDGIGTAQK